MSPSPPNAPLKKTGLTFWMIAVVIALVLAWAIWRFGLHSEQPTRNNPGVFTSSELIWTEA